MMSERMSKDHLGTLDRLTNQFSKQDLKWRDAQLLIEEIKECWSESRTLNRLLAGLEGGNEAIAKREMPIASFSVSTRVCRLLGWIKISTLGDLADLTEDDLSAYRNCGPMAQEEIKALLDRHGMTLRPNVRE